MSREVKFRFWSTVQSKMLDFMAIHFSNSSIIIKGSPPHEYPLEIPFDEGIIMQFTGLKDKNGKDIYEGDVCRISDPYEENEKIFMVEFKNGAFTVEWDSMFYDGSDMTTIGWALDGDFSIEVIGNMYENPELLTK